MQLLVDQLTNLAAGILPNASLYQCWKMYGIDPCRSCNPLTLRTLLSALTAERLWPMPPPTEINESISELLSKMRRVALALGIDKKDSDGKWLCNSFTHLFYYLSRKVKKLPLNQDILSNSQPEASNGCWEMMDFSSKPSQTVPDKAMPARNASTYPVTAVKEEGLRR